jgi:[ribosomal protein S18]-alanine N-acetyltransferase
VIADIGPVTPEEMEAINGWAYEPPYDFYDGDHEPVHNPERFFAAHDAEGSLVGFYYFERKGDVLEYGLGLRPDLTGHGHGLEFFKAGLKYGRERFHAKLIVLAVAAFNERAIKVYERAGFGRTGRHVRTLPGFGEVEFIDMEERC